MTPSRTARRSVAALALALALVAAGCGSSDSDGADATTTTAPAAGGAATTTEGAAPGGLTGTVNDEGTVDVVDQGAKATVEMELDDNYFKPTFVHAAPGATVTLELENEGDRPHTFTTDDGKADEELAPGASATVTVTVPDDGSLRFSCDFHGGMGMQGAFTVGGAASGGGTTTTEAAGDDDGSGGAGGY